MKKLLLLLIAVFAVNTAFSQDIIVFKTGDEIKAKILEITTDQIKYKKWDNVDGPTYSSTKAEVFMIKYLNGTKDVFKVQESVNITVAPVVNNEEIKKNEAVKKLESYVNNKLSTSIIKSENFRKTNGTMQNFGQISYIIEFNVDIRFIANGWKIKEGLLNYWEDFKIYGSEPDVSGLYYTTTRLFPNGTLVTLACVAEMSSTDNGFEVKRFEVRSFTDHGIVAIPNNDSDSNAKRGGMQSSGIIIKDPILPKATPNFKLQSNKVDPIQNAMQDVINKGKK